jgi:hypothetical protein
MVNRKRRVANAGPVVLKEIRDTTVSVNPAYSSLFADVA